MRVMWEDGLIYTHTESITLKKNRSYYNHQTVKCSFPSGRQEDGGGQEGMWEHSGRKLPLVVGLVLKY